MPREHVDGAAQQAVTRQALDCATHNTNLRRVEVRPLAMRGFAPFIATAVVLRTGDSFAGLPYTAVVAASAFIIGGLVLREMRGREMRS